MFLLQTQLQLLGRQYPEAQAQLADRERRLGALSRQSNVAEAQVRLALLLICS